MSRSKCASATSRCNDNNDDDEKDDEVVGCSSDPVAGKSLENSAARPEAATSWLLEGWSEEEDRRWFSVLRSSTVLPLQ